MAWIESHQELPRHPKTRRVARKLDVGVPTVLGHLHMLWYWCLEYRTDGVLSDMDAQDIADACGWEGDPVAFLDALFSSGWLDDDGTALSVHDWWEHAGQTIARRNQATDDQRRSGKVGAHRRWCLKEGRPIPNCPVCAAPEDDTEDGEPKGDPNGTHVGDPIGSDANRNRNRDKNKPKTSNTRKRATQLPDGWEPNEGHRKLATETGLNLQTETVQFRDHHAAKGSTFKDWDAAFRTWLRNAVEFGRGKRPPERLDNVVQFKEGGRF